MKSPKNSKQMYIAIDLNHTYYYTSSIAKISEKFGVARHTLRRHLTEMGYYRNMVVDIIKALPL